MKQYIWQNKSWPHFFWNPQSLIYPLANLYKKQGLLEGQLKTLTPSICKNIIAGNFASELVNSYKLDNIDLDENALKGIIAKKIGLETTIAQTSQISHEETKKLETIADVFLEIIRSNNDPLTIDQLVTWNKKLTSIFNSSEDENKELVNENFRNEEFSYIENDETLYIAPSPKSLKNEMEKFIKWYNTSQSFQELDNILKSAITQFYIIILQPFEKNNNTLARMLSYKVLYQQKSPDIQKPNEFTYLYSLSEQTIKYQKDYRYMINNITTGNMDMTIWLSWYIRNSTQAITSVTNKLDNLEKYELFMDKIKEKSVNKRQEKALLYMLTDDNKVTTTEYSKLCECSQDTASRDIEKLLSLDLVEKGDTGGRSTYYYVKL